MSTQKNDGIKNLLNFFLAVCGKFEGGFFYFAWALNEALVYISTLKKKIELSLSQYNIAGVERIHSGKKTVFEPLAYEY